MRITGASGCFAALTYRPELWVEVKDEQVRLILLEYCTERHNSSGSTAVHIEQSCTVVKAARHLQEEDFLLKSL